jgi:pimeloyl-ACP methyl ester carboxylesterase
MVRRPKSLIRLLLPRPSRRLTRRAMRLLMPSPGRKPIATSKAVLVPTRQRKAERNARPTGRFLSVDAVRVHYISRGKGRPVVLLHGNGAMAEDFVISGLVDLLKQRYRVIAIDRPGFGHTDRPRHRIWTPSAQAQLVQRVLARLKVERPVIVAHSWGTLVALAMASAAGHGLNGHVLRGLVLLSGYYYPTARADAAASAPLAVPGMGDAMRYMASPAVGHMVGQRFIRRAFWPRPVPSRFKARFPVDFAFRPEQLRATAEDAAVMPSAAAALRHSYPRLRLPVVIMSGEADDIIAPAAQSSRLHRDIVDSKLVIVPGVGHMIHYAARGRIARFVDALMG